MSLNRRGRQLGRRWRKRHTCLQPRRSLRTEATRGIRAKVEQEENGPEMHSEVEEDDEVHPDVEGTGRSIHHLRTTIANVPEPAFPEASHALTASVAPGSSSSACLYT